MNTRPKKSGQRPQPQRLYHRLVRLRQNPFLAHAPAAPGAQRPYVCVDPKGGVLSQVGAFLQRRGYQDQSVQQHRFFKIHAL